MSEGRYIRNHLHTPVPVQIRRNLLPKLLHALEGRQDDYDCELRYFGRPAPAIQSMDANHRVIYLNTFSKMLTHSSFFSWQNSERHSILSPFSRAAHFIWVSVRQVSIFTSSLVPAS